MGFSLWLVFQPNNVRLSEETGWKQSAFAISFTQQLSRFIAGKMSSAASGQPRRPTLKHDSVGSVDGHVHFNDSQITEEHAGHIQVQLSPDGTHADAHLGFLQVNETEHSVIEFLL